MDIKRGKFKETCLNWMGHLNAQIAFTGTALQQYDGSWISPEELAKNVFFAMERASRRILGRKAVRERHPLLYAGAIEGGAMYDFKRMHVHLGIGAIPPEVPLAFQQT